MSTGNLPSHDDLPRELRGLAAQLEAMGELERLAADQAVMRTTMRTAHLLTDRSALGPGHRLRALWLWLAAPAVAAAAVAVGVLILRTPQPSPGPLDSPEALAAGIEGDIDAWLELDSIWRADSFETNLAALSIDAAGITTGTDSLNSLPDLAGEL